MGSVMSEVSPVRQCAWLLVISVAALAVLAVPAVLVAGWPGLQGLVLSAVLCVIPGLITVGLASSVKDTTVRLWMALGGMLVRMLVILAAALVVRQLLPRFGFAEFYVWLVVFYNVLLLTETWLLLPVAGGTGSSGKPE